MTKLDPIDQQLIATIQGGLPLRSRPYEEIGQQIGLTETQVIERIRRLQENGTIKRLGVVVKHRALGFIANAMVVWDIPDNEVKTLAKKLAAFECVTLCYQRPRRLPQWRYNLFTMIHGRNRDSVLQRLDDIVSVLGLEHIPHEPLFSTKQFKQRGGIYIQAASPNKTIPFPQKKRSQAGHQPQKNLPGSALPLVPRYA